MKTHKNKINDISLTMKPVSVKLKKLSALEIKSPNNKNILGSISEENNTNKESLTVYIDVKEEPTGRQTPHYLPNTENIKEECLKEEFVETYLDDPLYIGHSNTNIYDSEDPEVYNRIDIAEFKIEETDNLVSNIAS